MSTQLTEPTNTKEIAMSQFIDSNRTKAATFLALADEHAAYIITSDLYTQNFVNALSYARHMVKGGSYSGGERDVIGVQLRKLERFFATPLAQI